MDIGFSFTFFNASVRRNYVLHRLEGNPTLGVDPQEAFMIVASNCGSESRQGRLVFEDGSEISVPANQSVRISAEPSTDPLQPGFVFRFVASVSAEPPFSVVRTGMPHDVITQLGPRASIRFEANEPGMSLLSLEARYMPLDELLQALRRTGVNPTLDVGTDVKVPIEELIGV